MVDTFYLKDKNIKEKDVGFDVIFTSDYMQIIQNKENTHLYSENKVGLSALFNIKMLEAGTYRVRSITSFTYVFKLIHDIVGDNLISYRDLGNELIKDSTLKNYFIHLDSEQIKFDNGEYIIKPYETGFKLYETENSKKVKKSNIPYASYTNVYTYIKYRLDWYNLGFKDTDLNFLEPNMRILLQKCFAYYGKGNLIEFNQLRNDLLGDKELLSKRSLTVKEINSLKLLIPDEGKMIENSPDLKVILRVDNPDIFNGDITFNIHLKISESRDSLKQWYIENSDKVIKLLNNHRIIKRRGIDLGTYNIKSVVIDSGNIMYIKFTNERK